jgi:ABC-type multidrug transport system fused ATPase/permease subunit
MFKLIHRIKFLLSAQKKKELIYILLLLLIGMFLEILGIGIIIPVLTIIVNPESFNNSNFIKNSYFGFHLLTQKELIFYAMSVIVVAYTIKSIFFWFFNKYQSRFIFGLSEDVSNRLFNGYLHLPYSFHSKYNSSHLLSNIQNEVIQYNYSIQALMVLATESLLSIAVTILLFILEPKGTFIIFFILTLVSLLIYRSTKLKLSKLGTDRQFYERECNQNLLQGLNGIKDVKVLGKEDQFFDYFSLTNKRRTLISAEQYAIQNSPKIFLEFFSIFSLVLLVLSFIFFSNPIFNLIPILGVFATASFRLLPSMNRIVGSGQLLRFSKSAIEKLYNEFSIIENYKSTKPLNVGTIKFAKILEIKNLCYTYPDTDTEVLHDISFKIPIGKSIGIIGESGSGKSTLINIILGLLEPNKGEISVDGKSIVDNIRSWQDQIGYVPQFIYLTDDTIKRNVAFGIPEIEVDNTALNNSLDMSQLSAFISGLPNSVNTKIGERGENLSGGQRQRLGIARSLYHNPQLLIFDEATSSLDLETEKALMESIYLLKGKRTLIIVSHRLETLKDCDWVINIEKGIITKQGLPELIIG